MTLRPDSPLGDPIKRIPLPNAPIERVVSQIRFPAILRMADAEFIAPFQEAIRKQYPFYEREESQSIGVGPQGVLAGDRSVVHRFTNTDRNFRVSLAPTFIALDQRGYDKREVFLERLEEMAETLIERFEPTVYERFGIRYIDRIHGEGLSHINAFLADELLGPLRHFEPETTLRRSLAEIEIRDGDRQLKARWGYIPAGQTLPTENVAEEPAFILDLDAYVLGSAALTSDSIIKEAQDLTDMIYRFFRWSVEDEFLKYYGADL